MSRLTGELAADSALSETTALRKLVTLGFLKLLDNFIGITVGFCDFWVVDNGFSQRMRVFSVVVFRVLLYGRCRL
jgi:hypothetical protein